MAGSTVSFVAEKLSNLLIEEVIFLRGVHDQVEGMERQLRWMQGFLRDADAKRRDHGVAYWVNQVREVAFDTEDIVDTYVLKMHRHQMNGFIKRYACIFLKLKRTRHIGMQIQGIKARVQEIHEYRTMYSINYNPGGIHEEMSLVDKTIKERRELAIRRDMNVVVGFEDDMKSILKELLDRKKKRRSVISLVGMGGIGKSTLARKIYDHNDIKKKFGDRRALVCVSQSYTINNVVKDIAKQLPNFEEKLRKKDDETEIKEKLPPFLKDSNYLIVLDDVWGTDVWDIIQNYLPDEQKGSRVIITTRSMDVARSAADPSTPPRSLKTLDERKSWDLFTKVVFPDEEVEKVCTGELQKLGKEIVKNCEGLPLALVVMGGLLSMKERSIRVWQNVREGFDWQGSPEGEVSLKILALSYEALPPHLKSCFLYFSCFPEDFEVDAEKLVRLWVAEGFIPDEEEEQQGRKSRTMEEIAEGWLDDLIQRCLVQAVKKSPSGRVLTCRLHDLLLDLAIKEGKEVNFFHTWKKNVVVGCVSPPSRARRLALHSGTEEYTSQEFSAPKLRTLLGFNPDIKSLEFIKGLRLLRVLDIEDARCDELPKAIGDLIHLRYLGLRKNLLSSIPSSIRKLRNLQSLDVQENRELEELPEGVWEIRTLRHVFIDRWIEPRIAGKVDQQLVNLQTLKEAKVGSWMQKSLATMRNLRVLVIHDISSPTHYLALTESLDSLLQLRSLELAGKYHGDGPLPRKALALPNHRHLEELTLWGPLRDHPERTNEAPPDHPNYTWEDLPPNLIKLVLQYSRLQQDPLSLLEKLPHLRFLQLYNSAYLGEEAVCSARGFPQLETLKIWGLQNIKKLTVEGQGALPRLNRLDIHGCDQLEEVSPQLKNVPTLDIPDRCFQENTKEAAAAAPQFKNVEVASVEGRGSRGPAPPQPSAYPLLRPVGGGSTPAQEGSLLIPLLIDNNLREGSSHEIIEEAAVEDLF